MQPDTTSPPPLKILVIDDNRIIQQSLQLALQPRGYKVFLAGDIATALKTVREEKPGLLLLDINFPPDSSSFGGNRDGFWALDWLRHMGAVNDMPVIVISGEEPENLKPRALAAGAAAYFQKPINADELAATIAGLLAGKKPV